MRDVYCVSPVVTAPAYDVDSDDLAELCDLDLGLAVSDPEQNEVEISLADLADLPELFDEVIVEVQSRSTLHMTSLHFLTEKTKNHYVLHELNFGSINW